MALWFKSIVASTSVVGLAIGGIMLILGSRFLKEFTRPGVTVEPGTPQWGGWTFPESADEPPTELQHAVTFPIGRRCTFTRGILGAGAKRADDHYQPWVSFPQCAFPLSRRTRICTWCKYFVVRLPWTWGECADSDNMRQRGGQRSGCCCGCRGQPTANLARTGLYSWIFDGSGRRDFATTTRGHCGHHRR